MKHEYFAIKLVCDKCEKESIYVEEFSVDETVRRQSIADGWTHHHDGTCTCVNCIKQFTKEYVKEYRKINKHKLAVKRKEYYKKNKHIYDAIRKRYLDKKSKSK